MSNVPSRWGWITSHTDAKMELKSALATPQLGLWLPRLMYLINLAFLGVYYPKFGRYAMYDWFGLMAVLTGFGYFVIRYRFPPLNRYILLFGGLLTLGIAATIPNVAHPYYSFFSGVLMLYTLTLWISLPCILFVKWEHLRAAFIALGISSSATAAYAIGQMSFGWPVLGHSYYWGRATGLTRHPNELGSFCAMVFPYLLCLTTTAEKRFNKTICAGGSLLVTLGVLLSGSMTSGLSLIAGFLGYFGLTTRRGRRRAVLLFLIGVIAMAGVTSIYSGKHTQFLVYRIERFLTSNRGKITLNQRLVANKNALQYIENNPLQGYGFHSRIRSIRRNTEIHNTTLRALYDGGMFTLLAVLSILIGSGIALFDAWRRIRWSNNLRHKPYIAGACGAFVALLVTMQASPILYQRSAWFPVALAFAVNLVSRRMVRGWTSHMDDPCQANTRASPNGYRKRIEPSRAKGSESASDRDAIRRN